VRHGFECRVCPLRHRGQDLRECRYSEHPPPVRTLKSRLGLASALGWNVAADVSFCSLMLAGDRLGFFVRPCPRSIRALHPRQCRPCRLLAHVGGVNGFQQSLDVPFREENSSPSNAGWRFV
jgi:hypothetical protein